MSGSAELQTRYDLACSLCSASHRVEVKNDMAISVYSCHDERSVVSTNHPQIRLLCRLLVMQRTGSICVHGWRKLYLWSEIVLITVSLNLPLTLSEVITKLFMLDSDRPIPFWIHLAFLRTILFCYHCFANGLLTWCQKTGSLLLQKADAIFSLFCASIPAGPLFISFSPCSIQAIKIPWSARPYIQISLLMLLTQQSHIYCKKELCHICHVGPRSNIFFIIWVDSVMQAGHFLLKINKQRDQMMTTLHL